MKSIMLLVVMSISSFGWSAESLTCNEDRAKEKILKMIVNYINTGAISQPTNIMIGLIPPESYVSSSFQVFYSYNQKTAMKPEEGHNMVGMAIVDQTQCKIVSISSVEVESIEVK